MKVICNAISSCHLCDGCGAANYHDKMGCEPCSVNKEAKCVPVIKEEEISISLMQYHLSKKTELQLKIDNTTDQFVIYGLSRQIQEAERAIRLALNSIIQKSAS